MVLRSVIVLFLASIRHCMAAQLAASGDVAAACIVNLIGSSSNASAGLDGSVSEASIRCTGDDKVSLILSADLSPFTEAFQGVAPAGHLAHARAARQCFDSALACYYARIHMKTQRRYAIALQA